MKSLLGQKEDALSITTERKNNIQIRESNNFFNRIDKLAIDHDVTVSNTMIKITYKKALKDQSIPDGIIDSNDSDIINISNKQIETATLCSSDISAMMKSFTVNKEGNKSSVFQSTPKAVAESEKKKKYVNGLNLSPTSSNLEGKSRVAKVPKKPSSQKEGASSLKKPEIISNKQIYKSELEKRFLKKDGLEKPKDSILERSKAVSKKIKLSKASNKKIKTLENGVKKKIIIDKKCQKIDGLKRKSSNSGFDVLAKCKKVKPYKTDSKVLEFNGSSEENSRSGNNKKPIMLVDPDLPIGWTRFIRTKNKGSANEQYVVYVVNPQGKKFRFKWKLRKYLQRTNSSLDADQFFFGLYQRPKTSNSAAVWKGEVSTHNALQKRSPESSRGSESELSAESDNQIEENEEANNESNHDPNRSSKGKELLLFDPDLPFGWKRIIHSNASNGRKQVHIISPDGKIFRRRYRLNEYLIKHQYNHNLNRFYFGLYAKKEGNISGNDRETEKKISTSVKSKYRSVNEKEENEEKERSRKKEYQKVNAVDATNGNYLNLLRKQRLCLILKKIDVKSSVCKPENSPDSKDSAMMFVNKSKMICNNDNDNDNKVFKDSKIEMPNSPMYDDPNLPKGWKRIIKIRSYGGSAGRMEVVIVSPDGTKHRSRKHLEHYLMQKNLSYKTEDFDFTVCGKANLKKRLSTASELEQELEPEPEPNDLAFLGMKKKFTDKPVPELDINTLKDIVITREGHMINTVTGLMMCSGLTSVRNERRQRLPRGEHEKQLKVCMNSQGDITCDGCEIPMYWIQKLVKCRGDFRILEPDAALAVAETTKEFIKKLSNQALAISKQPESGLRYEDIAELIDKTEGLSFLKMLIPKKITYKEYIKLNRPKQFMSFT